MNWHDDCVPCCMDAMINIQPSTIPGQDATHSDMSRGSNGAAFLEKLEMAVYAMEKTGRLDPVRAVINGKPVSSLVQSIMKDTFPDYRVPDEAASGSTKLPEESSGSMALKPPAGRDTPGVIEAQPGGPEKISNDLSRFQNISPLEQTIRKAAQTYGLDSRLIKAVIRVESNFNSHAVSKAGAKGLMQLMPATAKSLDVKDPFDAEQNILAGSRYLKHLLDHYHGDLRLALAAYNWGAGNLEQSPRAIPKATRRYIQKVMDLIEQPVMI